MRKNFFLRELATEVVNWKRETVEAIASTVRCFSWWKPPLHATWCRAGVERITKSAQADFVKSTGVELPYNIFYQGPAVSWPYSRQVVGRDEIVSAYARFAGWLKKAEELPWLLRFIKKTQSPRGVGSPRTTASLWAVWRWFPAPHKADRFVRRVHERASLILVGYGLRPSWRAMGVVLGDEYRHPKRAGKAALRVAALTVMFYCQGTRQGSGFYAADLWREPGWGRILNPRDFLARMRGWREMLATPAGIRGWVIEKVREGEFSSLAEALEVASSRLERDDSTTGAESYLDSASPGFLFGEVQVRRAWTSPRYGGEEWVWLVSGQTRDGRQKAVHVSKFRSVKEAAASI